MPPRQPSSISCEYTFLLRTELLIFTRSLYNTFPSPTMSVSNNFFHSLGMAVQIDYVYLAKLRLTLRLGCLKSCVVTFCCSLFGTISSATTFRETRYEVDPITVQQAAILKTCRFTFLRESSMSVVKKGKDLLELWSGNKNYIHSICRTHF